MIMMFLIEISECDDDDALMMMFFNERSEYDDDDVDVDQNFKVLMIMLLIERSKC